jgi:hypothetical protein
MSIPDRLFRAAKGHLNRALDRTNREKPLPEEVAELEKALEEARREVDRAKEALQQPGTRPAPGTRTLSTPGTRPYEYAPKDRRDPLDRAYGILELQPGATVAEAEAAYQRISAGVNPDRWTPGTLERRMAEQHRKELDEAIDLIRDTLAPTDSRFKSLEL